MILLKEIKSFIMIQNKLTKINRTLEIKQKNIKTLTESKEQIKKTNMIKTLDKKISLKIKVAQQIVLKMAVLKTFTKEK